MLLVSGFGTLETAIEAVRAGAFDYISKPFDIEEIKKTVQRALDQAGPRSVAQTPAVDVPAGRAHRTHARHVGRVQPDCSRR